MHHIADPDPTGQAAHAAGLGILPPMNPSPALAESDRQEAANERRRLARKALGLGRVRYTPAVADVGFSMDALYTFYAVITCGSFSLAASAMGISANCAQSRVYALQTSLRKQLVRLRVPDATFHGIMATKAGQALYARIAPMFCAIPRHLSQTLDTAPADDAAAI